MDTEKSSNSSFEDLSNVNDAADIKTATQMLIDNENNVKSSTEKTFAGRHTAGEDENTLQNKLSSALTTDRDNNTVISDVSNQREVLETEGNEISSSQNNQTQPTVTKASSLDDDPLLEMDSDSSSSGPSSESNNEPCDILGNGQLIKTVLVKSKTPKRPVRGELVAVNLTGKLESGVIVEQFDELQIHVGDFEVVQGLDMAIPLMNIDEVAEVSVDARFAYGNLGLKNEENQELSIPPNAKIIYTVKLLDIKSEDFPDLKSFELRRKYGNQKKERANFWYNRNEFNIAIQLYRRALDYLDDRDGDPNASFDNEDLQLSNADLQTLLNDRLVVYNNLAMAQIKISAFDAALSSVEHVLRCQPNNAKALYRKGRILEGKGDVKGAIALLQRAAVLEPDSKLIQQDLSKLFIKQRREEHNEKELYQKMLGQAKKMEQKNKQVQRQEDAQSSKVKFIGYIMGTILVGVAGVAIYRYKY